MKHNLETIYEALSEPEFGCENVYIEVKRFEEELRHDMEQSHKGYPAGYSMGRYALAKEILGEVEGS